MIFTTVWSIWFSYLCICNKENKSEKSKILFCFPVAPHELTEEEKQQILHSEEFLSFFDHSTRIVERALSEQINIFFDYSGRDLEDKEG